MWIRAGDGVGRVGGRGRDKEGKRERGRGAPTILKSQASNL